MPKSHLGAWKEYWDNYAEAFVQPLTANGLVGKFANNPGVAESYAEAWIKHIAASMFPHYRVSTGAVLRPADRNRNFKNVPQCDLIIWDPADLPALYEQGDFALVPWFSARAIIEIKRKCADLPAFRKQLGECRSALFRKYTRNVLGIVISHPYPLIDGEVDADWIHDKRWDDEIPIMRLLEEEPIRVDRSGLRAIVYFLSQIGGG